MKKVLLFLALFEGLLLYNSCTKDHASLPVAPSNCTGSMTYNLRVKNILDTYCTQPSVGLCHDQSAGSGAGHGPVFLYDSAHAAYAFQSQTAYACITGTGAYQMPPAPGTPYYRYVPVGQDTVPPDSVIVLQCWMDNGYH